MNDYQLYEYYLTKPLCKVGEHNPNNIYSRDYCVITGLAFMHPHPHRHYNFEEFLDKLETDPKFREFLNE